EKALVSHLQRAVSSPFLFLGSGFSRRYLGVEDWAGLLERFCSGMNDIHYYTSKANNDWALASTYVSEDLHRMWYADTGKAAEQKAYRDMILDIASPLKVYMSKYLKGLDYTQRRGGLSAELELLTQTNIDGVITTNWDGLVETLF